MEEKTWYLGPLGDLRALVVPEPGIQMNQVVYGGVHQGLTGARTKDVTGTRMDYDFQFNYLDQSEWSWLNALNTRLVPGPLYLIDPLRKNRITTHGCGMKEGASDPESVAYWKFVYEMSTDRPSAIDLPIRSIKLLEVGAATAYRPDPVYPNPVFPGETISASIYAKASASNSATLALDYFDADGTRHSSPEGHTVNATISTSWSRLQIQNHTVPAGVAGVRLAVIFGAGTPDVSLSAPQVETGSSATEWEPGGAGSRVLLNSLTTTSPRFPLTNSTLNLLEA